MTENLIIFNARVVTPVGFSARRGREMEELCIIDDATVEVTGGVITYVGPNRGEERDGYYQRYWHYNARGKCLLPGFVDSHTHFVFGGERAEEFSWRLKGESYMSIMERGGGIVSTVKATRECNFIQLRAKAEGFLKQMSTMGVTTVEGKSGYGLDKETELLQLRVMRSLNNDEHKRVDIVPTFLGAHAVPQEYNGRTDDYVDFIIREVMPAVVQNRLAEFCDVFCEQGVFSIGQSRRLLTAAREMGLLTALFGSKEASIIAFPAIGFSISMMYSIVFSLALNSASQHHGSFAGILCSAIVGGAGGPMIISMLADATSLRTGMLIILVFVGYITFIGFWAHPLINNKTVSLKELFRK